MQKMSPTPSFAIALEIHAGRIPVRWTLRESKTEELRGLDGRVLTPAGVERVFWPQVVTTAKTGDAVVSDLEDPLELRAVLFRSLNTKWSERTAQEFLDRVGAWRIVPGGVPENWAEGTYATIAFRHRFAVGVRVLPVTLDELRTETAYWYGLLGPLGNSAKMKKAFGAAPPPDARPADHFAFATDAHFNNTLPVSLEWQGASPRAVIEPLSASELLAAAAWADVAGCAEPQVCARCHTRFTWPRKKTYCLGDCAHQVAVRTYKRKKAAEKKVQMASKTGLKST